MLELDHLVLTCLRLADGVQFIEERLGTRPIPGGKHPRMGTHNALLRIGDKAYLEVLAPDPGVPTPSRPRWFGLDLLDPNAPPRLATWVARTSELATSLFPVEEMSRGELRWRLTVPPDGRILENGVVPYLIDWETSPHPVATLPASGCQLLSLELAHPKREVVADLRTHLGAGSPHIQVRSGGPLISAMFSTPAGMAALSST